MWVEHYVKSVVYCKFSENLKKNSLLLKKENITQVTNFTEGANAKIWHLSLGQQLLVCGRGI